LSSPVPSGEVFALDFVASHPQVLVAGGRGPAGICVTDLREEPRRRVSGAAAERRDARVDGGAGVGVTRRRDARGNKIFVITSHRRNTLYDDSSRGTALGPDREEEPQNTLLCHPGYHDARHRALLLPEGVTDAAPPGVGGGFGGGGGRRHRWLQVARERVVNHLVSLNQFQVLSAGVEGRMHVWDLRRGVDMPYTTYVSFVFFFFLSLVGLGSDGDDGGKQERPKKQADPERKHKK
jgi:hypothetical protein